MTAYLLFGIYILAGGVGLSNLICPVPNPIELVMLAFPICNPGSAAEAAAFATSEADKARVEA